MPNNRQGTSEGHCKVCFILAFETQAIRHMRKNNLTNQAGITSMSHSGMQALQMGLINTVVPLEQLEEETVAWCREMLRNSPTALRVLKAALNAAVSGACMFSIPCTGIPLMRSGQQDPDSWASCC